MAEPLSLDTTEPAQDTALSMDTGQPVAGPPTAQRASVQAARASFALTEQVNKSHEDIFSTIQQGREDAFRQEAAANADFKKRLEKNKFVQQVISQAPDAAALAKDKFTMAKLMGQPVPTDPNSVVEEYYAGQYLKPMTDLSDQWTRGSFMTQAVVEDPEHTDAVMDVAHTILGYKQYAAARAEKAEHILEQQSILGKGVDLMKGLVPFLNELKVRGWVGGVDWKALLGTDLEEQRQRLYSLPQAEFKEKFNSIMDKLEHDNPQMAVLFAHAMVGQAIDEIENNNVTTLGDIATLIPIGTISKIGLRSAVKRAAQDVVKSDPVWLVDSRGNVYTNTPEQIKAAAASGRGDLKTAAQLQLQAGLGFNQEKKAVEAVPSFLPIDAERYRTNPGASGQEIANRVAEQTANNQMDLEKAVNNAQKINRIPALIARSDIAKMLTDSIKGKYSGPNSKILNVDFNNLTWFQASNTYRVPIIHGTEDGEFFARKSQAVSAAEMQGLPLSETADVPGGKGNIIHQQGQGYYIRSWVPINETESALRDVLLDTPNAWSGPSRKGLRMGAKTPGLVIDPLTGEVSQRPMDVIKGFMNSGPSRVAHLFGWRTPEETLSPVENEMRGIATFSPSNLMELFSKNNELIRAGRTKNNLRVMVNNQNMLDPVTQEHGYFFPTIGEYENHYLTVSKGVLPTAKETEAYFAMVNNYEMERSLRALSMIRNKSRLGFMQYRVWHPENETEKSFTRKYSDHFDARPLNDLPRVSDPVFVNINGKHTVKKSSALLKHEREGIALGKYKVLELWNREERPLHGYSDKIHKGSEPRFVLTDQIEQTPLELNRQVPRRGGGHWIFEYEHYMRQSDVYTDPVSGQTIYRGDITAMPFQLRSLGQTIVKHFNEIRKLIAKDDIDGARAYVRKMGVAGLDFDKDILPHFKAGPNGRPRFNLTEDFRLTSKDQTTMSMDNRLNDKYQHLANKFIDSTKNGNISRSASVEFAGKRDAYDLHTIHDEGSARNPVYSYRPAQLMDPMDAMNRSMTKLVNSFYMDDYKYFATEHWLQTYMPWLKADKDDIRHAPFHYFLHADFKPGMPDYAKSIAIANRKKIQDFIGTPNTFTNMVHSISQALMDATYARGVKAKYLPIEQIAFTKNPTMAIRALVGDMKLGLGSIPAFFMQASAMSNVLSIAFKQGPSSVMAAFFHNWSRVNPTIVEELDKMASKGQHLRGMLGFQKWMPGQLKEAHGLFIKSGFDRVGAEHAMFDNMLADRGVRTAMDTVRYWGRTFFREGAQLVRQTAYYAAYLEHRDANPIGAITRADEAKILGRAKILDHDMNRSSASALNSGVMSIPSQFYNYGRNLAEMFYGKRLTPMEKARLFAVNSVLWGIPAGGMGLFGVPVGEWIRKQAIEAGYIPGDDAVTSTAMEGGISALQAYITGGGDIQRGTVMHYGKFGVPGWDPLNNFLDQDKTFTDFMFGASGNVLKNTWQRSSNLRRDMISLFNNDDQFKFKWEDLADVLKDFSGFGYSYKLYTSMATGQLMSANNTPITNITTGAAIQNFLMGTVPADVADIGAKKKITETREGWVKEVTRQFQRNLHLALLARKDGDMQGYTDYMRKANAYLSLPQFPPHEKMRVMNQGFGQFRTLVESQDWSLGHRNVPQKDQGAAEKRFEEVERLRRKREQ